MFVYHQYHIVGRHIPSEKYPEPKVYRMKVWAKDAVKAKSKFWYFMKQLCRVKKANGQIIACNEIFEKDPETVKNYGFWLRVESRSGVHNMYKEFRDVTMNGAVDRMYMDMASRHRARARSIQIIKTAVLPDSYCKRTSVTQFHGTKDELKFPLPHKIIRPSSKMFRTSFKATKPVLSMF